MKTLVIIAILFILFIMWLLLTGCMAEVEYTNPTTGAKIRYSRWGDQKIEGLVINLPDGTRLELNKQESASEAVTATITALSPLLIP